MNTSGTSRRNFLVAGIVGLTVGALGFSWSRYAGSRERWIESVVRDNLPGVDLDAGSLASFVEQIARSDALMPTTHRLAVFADETVPWVTASIPKVRNGLDKLERHVLTEYLVGSNFFRIPDPKRETIVYYGPAIACSNPFVSFT
jgi:hypothetical protein